MFWTPTIQWLALRDNVEMKVSNLRAIQIEKRKQANLTGEAEYWIDIMERSMNVVKH